MWNIASLILQTETVAVYDSLHAEDVKSSSSFHISPDLH